jgi:hypothetical protein
MTRELNVFTCHSLPPGWKGIVLLYRRKGWSVSWTFYQSQRIIVVSVAELGDDSFDLLVSCSAVMKLARVSKLASSIFFAKIRVFTFSILMFILDTVPF